MAKDILIAEQNGEFLDIWIQDSTQAVSEIPGWVRIRKSDGIVSSGLRILESVEDSGLQRIRVKPTSLFMLKSFSKIQNGEVERVGEEASSTGTFDDASGYNPYSDYGNTKSIVGIEWKAWYWIPVVILLYLGYRKLSK